MNNDNNNEPLLLNYYDACIYQRDLALLQSDTAWLNDACINFYMTFLSMLQSQRWETYLQQHSNSSSSSSDGMKDDTTTCNQKDRKEESENDKAKQQEKDSDIVFLDPSVISFMMHQCEDEDDLYDVATSWKPKTSVKRFYIPLNDNFAVSKRKFAVPGGGTHWSLLLVICYVMEHKEGEEGDKMNEEKEEELKIKKMRQQPKYQMHYLHFDSSCGHNSQCAKIVARRFHRAMQLVFSNDNNDGNKNDASNEVNIMECNAPQQTNSYDCGVYTLIAAEALSDPSLLSYCANNDDNSTDWEAIQRYHEDALQTWCQTRNGGGDKNVGAAAKSMRRKILEDIQRLSKVYLERQKV